MTPTVEAEATNRDASNSELIAALRSSAPEHNRSEYELDLINDTERGRWIIALGAEAIGELNYRFVGGRVVLLSIWVNHAYRNRRVATEVISRILEEIRGAGKKITIICPVVGEFVARNPQYLDLIDKTHPGSGAYPPSAAAAVQDDEGQFRAFEHDIV